MALIIVLALFFAPAVQGQTPPPQPAAQTAPRPSPCNTPEYQAFDFWVGTWEVKNPLGRVLGVNVIEKLPGNCGVHEHWMGAAGGGGDVLHLSGGLKDGAMVMEGTSAGPNHTTLLNRVTWTPDGKGGLRQYWVASPDQGKTWSPVFDGHYTKKP